MSGANKHPYHLVEASPWPAVGAAAAFTAAVGGVMYMHEVCLLYTSPSPRDGLLSRMPSSA